jgi:hypothetical protein
VEKYCFLDRTCCTCMPEDTAEIETSRRDTRARGEEICFLSKMSRPALGPNRLAVQ